MKISTFKKVWRVPLLLGALILFGLLAALLGTGFCYWLAWTAMAIPLILVIYHTFKK